MSRLHQAVAELSPQDAKKYMKMCVDSGLWCPADKDEFNRDDEDEGEEEGNNEDNRPQVEEL